MKLTYTQIGDYFFPNLTVPPTEPLGKYGRMRFDYLEKERPILFNRMLLSDELYGQRAEIDKAASNRVQQIVTALAKAEGVDEAMKASNSWRLHRRRDSRHSRTAAAHR